MILGGGGLRLANYFRSGSGSYVNIHKVTFCCTSDNTQKLYVYGEGETPRYPYTNVTGTTYCVIPK